MSSHTSSASGPTSPAPLTSSKISLGWLSRFGMITQVSARPTPTSIPSTPVPSIDEADDDAFGSGPYACTVTPALTIASHTSRTTCALCQDLKEESQLNKDLVQAMSEQMQGLEKECDNAKQELEKCQTELQDTWGLFEQRSGGMKELLRQMGDKTEEIGGLARQIREQKAVIEDLEQEIREQNTTIAKLEQLQDQLTSKTNEIGECKVRLRKPNREEQDARAQGISEDASLEQELDVVLARKEALEDEVRQLKQATEDQSSSQSEAKESQDLKSQLKDARKGAVEDETKIDNLRQDLRKAHANTETYAAFKIGNLEYEIEELKDNEAMKTGSQSAEEISQLEQENGASNWSLSAPAILTWQEGEHEVVQTPRTSSPSDDLDATSVMDNAELYALDLVPLDTEQHKIQIVQEQDDESSTEPTHWSIDAFADIVSLTLGPEYVPLPSADPEEEELLDVSLGEHNSEPHDCETSIATAKGKEVASKDKPSEPNILPFEEAEEGWDEVDLLGAE
ncbi:hypothetical protein BCR34DRAFT_619303 [Clohesyomyces aquaticus]|uniref:Uncharacterized protein n=1 Tax=Clohesyomyces aquaticus TaxID=1231657 RepID=A0A1Y1YJ12_9PLEO|nr:hypothetical protein BCR34DRAFT_619303 [Clohesyomyces aquaticus]